MANYCTYNSKEIIVNKRSFRIQSISFTNGYFVSISEEETNKFGSMTFSIKINNEIAHQSIIPDSRARSFPIILSDIICKSVDGMSLLSLYVSKKLDSKTEVALLEEIKNYLKIK